MDGVNVEQAIGRDRIRSALKRYENKPVDEHRYGLVRSVNADGSYEVLLDGDVQTSRCAQFDTALVGDRVLAVTKKDGTNDLLGRLGGPIGGGGTIVMQYDDVSNYIAGRVFAYAGADEPIGALLCDGRAVSRTTYWELFAAIGTTYGAGDGSTTFNLPNIESRTIIGEGTGASGTEYALGDTGGEEKHKQTLDELASHRHYDEFTNVTSSAKDGCAMIGGYTVVNSEYLIGKAAGGDQPFNVMQPYIVMRYFITTGKGDPVSGINPADYVVEWERNDSGWSWEKYASGRAVCWGLHLSTPYGTGQNHFSLALPFSFEGEYQVDITPSYNCFGNYASDFADCDGYGNINHTEDAFMYTYKYNSSSICTVGANFRVTGKWKETSASGGTETIAPTIEERFEALEPVVLYDNISGSAGTIQLSETTANFSSVKVFFTDNVNGGCSSAEIHSPNGNVLHHVQVQEADASNFMYFRFSAYRISGTTIAAIYNDTDKPGFLKRSFVDGSMSGEFGQFLKIARVVGYR